MTRTLVVSDLHLGSRAGNDVLRRDGVLEVLLDALERVDRLVLLGDTFELRQGSVPSVLGRARRVLERLGAWLGDRPVVLVPGNHDHALITGWLERRERPLELERRWAPAEASFAAEAASAMLAPASVEVAYPGVWLADGVYATHGHYLDLHMTVPTIERVAVAISGRVALDSSRRWDDVHSPDDYEAVVAPLYAWVQAAAQSGRSSATVEGGRTVGAWQTLRGSGRARALRGRALPLLFPWAVRAANAAGLGPLRTELSTDELRRAGLRAAGAMVERLAIDARHVIFGHTHRAGMIEGDEPAEWLTPNGVHLHNAGSWVYTGAFARGPESPYWPGTAVLVEDGSPPRLLRLLADSSARALGG
ncbi:MAG TPA: metallophosphoesterase [Solirubrobacteraceae bacterium]|nr:metallophosphoesterase [Solirubrobacteraceae bacterium]